MGLIDTKEKRQNSKLMPQHISDLVKEIETNKITRTAAKTAMQEISKTGKSLSDVISKLGLGHVSDESELTKIIDQVLLEETNAVKQAKTNPETINYLVGKVMQKTKGNADPILTLEIIQNKIRS